MTLRTRAGSSGLVSTLATCVTVSFVAFALVFGTATAGADLGSAPTIQFDDEEYSVVQGDRCVPVQPFGDGERSVEEYYDYRTPYTEPSAYTYSSYGTTDLQQDDASVVSLYEGRDGLSLVLLHDRYGGATEGGAVTMDVSDLPRDGEWVVEDDNYPDQEDEFFHWDTSSRITWVWTEERNDGAAFNGGLDDEFAIQIDPAFNDEADFSVYNGSLTDWQVASATGDDGEEVERTSLDMSEPIEIRSEGCTSITGIDVDETATVGGSVDVEVTVENLADEPRTVTVPFAVDGEVVDEQRAAVEAGETTTVVTSMTFGGPGTRTVSVGEESATVDVSEGGADGLPGFGVAITVLAALLALVARNRA